MKKTYIFVCVISFFLLYENLNQLLVALIVGNYQINEALQKAFAFSTLQSALFAGIFRIIAFAPLILCAAFTKLLHDLRGKAALYIALLVTIVVIFSGYWEIIRPLYTDEHASSTAAIGYIFIPFYALFLSSVAGVATYVLLTLYAMMFRRT